MKNIAKLILISALSFSHSAMAIDITFNETQINQMLNFQFPVYHNYQGLAVTVREPMVDLYAKNQSVTIFAKVHINDGINKFEASFGLNGSVSYSSTGMLSVKDPSIVEFDITENTLFKTQQAIENIKSALGRQVPVEISFNAQALNLGGLNLSPKSLTVIDNGLVVSL